MAHKSKLGSLNGVAKKTKKPGSVKVKASKGLGIKANMKQIGKKGL